MLRRKTDQESLAIGMLPAGDADIESVVVEGLMSGDEAELKTIAIAFSP